MWDPWLKKQGKRSDIKGITIESFFLLSTTSLSTCHVIYLPFNSMFPETQRYLYTETDLRSTWGRPSS